LLSNNLLKGLWLLFLLIIIFSCSDKKEKIPVLDFEDKTQVLDAVKKYYNSETQIARGGLFDETGKQFIAAGMEINNSEEWGIKFTFLEKSGNEFIPKYETELLDGSFKECFVDKIKFSSIDYDLIYYNSQGYFMGSSGGEIFSYIVDFENRQVYYAHLAVEAGSSISLFISENTQNKELKDFFMLTFKKDYPNLKIVEDDIVVD
jgi:hypothetical protein